MKVSKFRVAVLVLLAVTVIYIQPTSYGSVVHDIAIVGVTVYPTKALAGATVTINATIENQGTSHGSFNVTMYFDNHTIQTLTVTNLASGLNTTLTFGWEIFPYRSQIFPPPWELREIMIENCKISVEADAIPGEIDTSDNVYINGTVTVIWWCIDLNGDGKINIIDVSIMAKVFDFDTWHPCVDPAWDLYQDGKISIRDIAIVAKSFGKDYMDYQIEDD